MANFTTDIDIDAPVERVWEVLADIGAIAEWNPGVKESYATSDDMNGLGATRFCDLGGQNYLNEEVVQWETHRKLTMRIVESNMPFQHADIHFTLHGQNGTTNVAVSPEYELKYGPVGKLMDHFYVRNTYQKGMRSLLRGLKEYVENNSN